MKNFNLELISKILRQLGGLLIVLSGTVFLFQGYHTWDSFERFMMFSLLLTILGTLGIYSAQKLADPKGARTFLALSTLGISALFAQLGAMIYNLMHGFSSNLPTLMKIEITGIGQLSLAAIITFIVTGLFSFFGFKVLNRQHHKLLFLSYLLLNFLLLIPSRTVWLPTLSILILILILLFFGKKLGGFDLLTSTFERYSSFIILTTPTLISIIRYAFYNFNTYFLSLLSLQFAITSVILSYMVYLQKIKKAEVDNWRKRPLQASWISPAVFLLLSELFLITKAFSFVNLSDELGISLIILMFHGTLRLFTHFKLIDNRSTIYPVLWVVGLVFLTHFTFIKLNYIHSLSLLVLTTIGIVDSIHLKQKFVFYTCFSALIVSIIQVLIIAIDSINFFHWINLALIGGLGILISSQIEKHASKAKEYYFKFQAHFE
ncbi:MAG: hypothetical protein KDD58_02490 [Bdellovibrionales bacterium]|nr:hypothetical protein [Bdellovibrionales bacterium]